MQLIRIALITYLSFLSFCSVYAKKKQTIKLSKLLKKGSRTIKKQCVKYPTEIIIGINVIIFCFTETNSNLKLKYMKIDQNIWRKKEYYRLISSTFLHASVEHITANAGSLMSIGSWALKEFGLTRYLIVYVLSGVLANVITLYLGCSPYALGASGSICGVIGGLAAYNFEHGAMDEESKTHVWKRIAGNFFANVAGDITAEKREQNANKSERIDHVCHVAGFLCGALVYGALAFFDHFEIYL